MKLTYSSEHDVIVHKNTKFHEMRGLPYQ